MVMATDLEIRDLRTSGNQTLIERIYKEILEPAFDPAELDPLEVMLDGLSEQGSYEAWGLCALDRDGVPVSVVLGYPFMRSKVLLIGYIASRSGERSRGAGSRLIEEAHRQWFARPGINLVIAEVEDPRHFHPVGNIDPGRRVAFYAHHGCEFVVGPYFQPQVREGAGRVYHLLLTILHADSEAIAGPGRAVHSDQLVDFFDEYFGSSIEAVPPLKDPEGEWLVGWYRDREVVELQPIANYVDFPIPSPPGRD